jgi:hypothetical protein
MSKHPLNQHFDNIYVPYINSTELSNIKWKLEEEGITVEYFKGYNGLTMNGNEYTTFLKNQVIKKKTNKNIVALTKGQYGHLKTFTKICDDAIKKNYKKILCLEPDIYLCENFKEEFVHYENIDYKILYLGGSQYCFYKEKTWETVEKKNRNMIENKYYHPYKTLGTFAIALDCTIFGEFLDSLKKMERPTDVILTYFQEKYAYASYVCYPNVVSCNVVKSSTSGIRKKKIVQTQTIAKYRWNLNYDTRKRIVINSTKNKTYKIIFMINSKLRINGIKMEIPFEYIKRTSNIIIINFKSITTSTNIELDGLFIDSLDVVS